MTVHRFKSIGIIHSPHQEPAQTPIQPVFAADIRGTVEIFEPYMAALDGLKDFSHVYLVYVFHRSRKTRLRVIPYLSSELKGVFATRSPHRPNKIGISLVRILGISGSVIEVADLDVLDGTPLLDIKPYVKRFDSREDVNSGWQDGVTDTDARRLGLRNYKPH